MKLWHYTCDHAAQRIGMRGWLRPHAQPALGMVELVWLTDLAVPDMDGLGLTSSTLDCDRTACRYQATSHVGVMPWMTSEVRAAHPEATSILESYGQPLRWWVALGTVPVVRADG